MQESDSMDMHTYWLPQDMFKQAQGKLGKLGYSFTNIFAAPYQALRTQGQKLVYAPPELLSGMWTREVSNITKSQQNEGYLIASANPLPKEFDDYLDGSTSPNESNEIAQKSAHSTSGDPMYTFFDHGTYMNSGT